MSYATIVYTHVSAMTWINIPV